MKREHIVLVTSHAEDTKWHKTDPDKVLRRPELYERYVNTLVDVLGEKRGLSAEEKDVVKSRISMFNADGAEAIGSVYGGSNPETEHDPAREIVRDYFIRKRRLRNVSERDLNAQIEGCLELDSCMGEAFTFRIKSRIRRKRFELEYEPEEYEFGLVREKDIGEALDDVKGRPGFDSHPYDEQNIRRAVEEVEQLIEESRADQNRNRDEDGLTGVVRERRR